MHVLTLCIKTTHNIAHVNYMMSCRRSQAPEDSCTPALIDISQSRIHHYKKAFSTCTNTAKVSIPCISLHTHQTLPELACNNVFHPVGCQSSQDCTYNSFQVVYTQCVLYYKFFLYTMLKQTLLTGACLESYAPAVQQNVRFSLKCTVSLHIYFQRP